MNSVRSRRVVVDGGEETATVRWSDGVVTSIDDGSADLDVGELVVSPGLVDSHVHVNEPGRTEWEGFATATAAAAAGGTTTMVDMPLNCVPPTVDVDALQAKVDATEGKLSVDTAFWGGMVPTSDLDAISGLIEQGVCGFKVFLADSGVPEFPPVTLDQLSGLVEPLVEQGLPLLVHAEDQNGLLPPTGHPADHLTHLRSRPPVAEESAIRDVVELSTETGVHTHILHLAASGGVELVKEAREAGIPISCETCPHYLYLDGESIPTGATEHKCAPPLRGSDHIAALWEGLEEGDIDMVVSDHSPSPPGLKTPGDFITAWGGIASLQLRLPIVWTGARERGYSPTDLVSWLSEAPARLAGLDDRKGSIEVGGDADLVIWDPDTTFVVHGHDLYHRHPITPYEGQTLYGRIHHTILRGHSVFRGDEVIPGHGRRLTREST